MYSNLGIGDICNFYYPIRPKRISSSRFLFLMCAQDNYETIRNKRIARCAHHLWLSNPQTQSLDNWCEANKIISDKYYYCNHWMAIVQNQPWNLLPQELVHKIANMCKRRRAFAIGYDT